MPATPAPAQPPAPTPMPETGTRPQTKTLYDSPEYQESVARKEAVVEETQRQISTIRMLREEAAARLDERLRRLG